MLFCSCWFSSFVDAAQLKNITKSSFLLRPVSFISAYAKFSEKITFIKYVCVSGAK